MLKTNQLYAYLEPTQLLRLIGSRHLKRVFSPSQSSYEGTNPGLHRHTTFPECYNWGEKDIS